jgi:hypothetical protein
MRTPVGRSPSETADLGWFPSGKRPGNPCAELLTGRLLEERPVCRQVGALALAAALDGCDFG